jgi:hypothetical protein
MGVVDFVPTITRLTNTKMAADYVSDGMDESAVLLGNKQKVAKELYWYYNNNPVPGKKENISPTLAMLQAIGNY